MYARRAHKCFQGKLLLIEPDYNAQRRFVENSHFIGVGFILQQCGVKKSNKLFVSVACYTFFLSSSVSDSRVSTTSTYGCDARVRAFIVYRSFSPREIIIRHLNHSVNLCRIRSSSSIPLLCYVERYVEIFRLRIRVS